MIKNPYSVTAPAVFDNLLELLFILLTVKIEKELERQDLFFSRFLWYFNKSLQICL